MPAGPFGATPGGTILDAMQLPAPLTAAPVAPLDPAVVRDVVKRQQQPLVLARCPLASGGTAPQRIAAVRAQLDEALDVAFGSGPRERLLREVLRRAYYEPQGSIEAIAAELELSRATLFRRLRLATERVVTLLCAAQ